MDEVLQHEFLQSDDSRRLTKRLRDAEAARETFGRRRIDGFAFDVEILFIARKLGHQVAEIPVIWINDEASRVDPIRHSIQMFRDIVGIRRLHRGL